VPADLLLSWREIQLGGAHVGEQGTGVDEPTRGPVGVPGLKARDGRHAVLLTSCECVAYLRS
jgi:hypothetical protein